MGNDEDERTASSIEIVENGPGQTTADHDRHHYSDKPDVDSRPRNPYFYGAWGLVSVMIGLGTLWIIGFSPGIGPELYRTDIVVGSSTGAPIYESPHGAAGALGNLSSLAPGLFFIGLSGALVLLLVQGVMRQRQSDI